jgi:ADP-ribose pyrophosphatase
MSPDDVKIIEKTTPFQGYFRVDRYTLSHALFEGGWSGEMTREVFERGHAVTVVLYDAEMEKLVLIEQFRAGAFAALSSPWFDGNSSPWLIETIAGIIDDDETPDQVARREAMEEAGCEIRDLIPVCHYLASPGGSSESMFVYFGRVDASKAGGIHGLTGEHENIRVLVTPVETVFQWLDAGKIINAMTIIALQCFRARHPELRERWKSSSPPEITTP